MPNINEILVIIYAYKIICTALKDHTLILFNFIVWIKYFGAITHDWCNIDIFDDISSIFDTTVKISNNIRLI